MENNSDLTFSGDPGTIQTVELMHRRWLTQNTFEIELTRPPSFEFNAGQTIRFIYKSWERYYSLLSTPADPTLSLCIHCVQEGQFSPALASAEIGSHFNITGPHGYFIFQPSERRPVFVATGTGIAPFVSMARAGATQFVVLHEAKSSEELYYHSYFRENTSDYFACLPDATNPEASLLGAYQSEVAVCLQKHLPPESYDFYLCGHRKMIQDVTLLVDEAYPESLVYTEVFY